MIRRWLKFFFVLTVAGGIALINSYYIPNFAPELAQSDSLNVFPISVKTPTMVYGMILPEDHEVIEDKVKRNQRLGDILEAYNVPARFIHEVSNLSRKIFDPRKIAANKKYTVIVDQDSLKTAKALVYETNAIEYVVFKFGDSLSVDVCHRDVVTVEKSIAGVIGTSLSETIEQLGISHELTNRFVDIFGWQVDFGRLQKGDKFKLIYQELQVEGIAIGIKQIDGIYFNHFGFDYYAFPLDQGTGVDYFNEDGRSLRKALLKYPIEFTHISSRFTMNRFHPVQRRWKAHLGTDFAAPTGTPIRSVGDGIILEAQYKSNNGNYVKIKHNSTYTTQYLHMSRIASGVRAGMRVRQGQTIGYVGSTGLATGPHLCYRFWKNGKQVDALRADLPAAQPVRKEFQSSFEVLKGSLKEKLQAIPFPQEVEETIASIQQ
jgi:murein DD-endopeptidase MepM/ murein hydrolase activator NlpD